MHNIDAEMAAVIDRLRRLRAEVQRALRASATDDHGDSADVDRRNRPPADNTTRTGGAGTT